MIFKQTLFVFAQAALLLTSAQAQPVYTTIHNFNNADGNSPQSGLITGKFGKLYGTTAAGGTGAGVVYSLTPPAAGKTTWTEKVIHQFQGTDGADPTGALILGSGAVLYGTTYSGGTAGLGVVFQLTPPALAGQAWAYQVIHNFIGGADGANPPAAVSLGSDGVLYGTTVSGGAANFGTVFSLTPPTTPGNPWTEAILHSFDTTKGDGVQPVAALLVAPNRTLFGTTLLPQGVIFALTPPAAAGGDWVESVLYAFQGGVDGELVYSNLLTAGGRLYGTTYSGGTANLGTVFQLAPAGPGSPWQKTTLYNFQGNGDGASPGNAENLVLGKAGVLYGVTSGQNSGAGTIFSLTPPSEAGSSWIETVLYTFPITPINYPIGLLLSNSSYLYGALNGGASDGSVFSFGPLEGKAFLHRTDSDVALDIRQADNHTRYYAGQQQVAK